MLLIDTIKPLGNGGKVYWNLIKVLQAARSSGVAKGGPGQARAQPKHHVRTPHVTQSRTKHTWAWD